MINVQLNAFHVFLTGFFALFFYQNVVLNKDL